MKSPFSNAFRVIKMFAIIGFGFHWVACSFFSISRYYGIGSDDWVFKYDRITDVYYDCKLNTSESTLFSNLTVSIDMEPRELSKFVFVVLLYF